jgi:hypothetical protein
LNKICWFFLFFVQNMEKEKEVQGGSILKPFFSRH